MVKGLCGRDTVIFQANSSWGWRAVFLAQHMFAQWLWEPRPPGAEFCPMATCTHTAAAAHHVRPLHPPVKKTSIYRTRQTNSLFRLLKTNKIPRPQAPCAHVWFCKNLKPWIKIIVETKSKPVTRVGKCRQDSLRGQEDSQMGRVMGKRHEGIQCFCRKGTRFPISLTLGTHLLK